MTSIALTAKYSFLLAVPRFSIDPPLANLRHEIPRLLSHAALDETLLTAARAHQEFDAEQHLMELGLDTITPAAALVLQRDGELGHLLDQLVLDAVVVRGVVVLQMQQVGIADSQAMEEHEPWV